MTKRNHPIKSLARAPAKPKRNLDTFRATHDPATRAPLLIAAALKRMKAEFGSDWYMYEQKNPAGAPDSPTFCAYSGVASKILPDYRQAYREHIVRTKDNANGARYVWFATPAAALQARGRAVSDADFM